MSTCPNCGLDVWSTSVTPANLLRNISNTHAYIVKVPTNNPSFHLMFHIEKLLKKFQQALQSFILSRSCYRTPGNNVPSPNPRILYVSSLPSLQKVTQRTLSPFSIFGPILYLTQITFPSSLHASYLLCSIFTGGWTTSQMGGLFHSRDSPISNLPSSYKSADSTCQVRDSTTTQLKSNSFSATNTVQITTGMNNQKYRTTPFPQNQTQP